MTRVWGHDANCHWINILTYTQKVKLHMARAFLANPEVIVLDRPLMHFGPDYVPVLLDLFRDHVHNKGIGMPEASRISRRPRTLFYTAETREQLRGADVIWHVANGRVAELSSGALVQPRSQHVPREASFTTAHPLVPCPASPLHQAPWRHGPTALVH